MVILRCLFTKDCTNCSKVRAARAARLYFLVPQIKVLVCDVVVVAVVDVKALSHLALLTSSKAFVDIL